MIKTVTIERRECDSCGNEAYEWTACLSCGKDLCPEGVREGNSQPHGIRYPHSVNCSGSYDGYYCLPCDMRLSEDRSDSLHQAYVAIRTIRDERERDYQAWRKLETEADDTVMRLRAARGLR